MTPLHGDRILPAGFTGVDRGANIDIWVPIGALATSKLGAGWHVCRGPARARHCPSASRCARVGAQAGDAGVSQRGDSARRPIVRHAGKRGAGSINSIVEPGGVPRGTDLPV